MGSLTATGRTDAETRATRTGAAPWPSGAGRTAAGSGPPALAPSRASGGSSRRALFSTLIAVDPGAIQPPEIMAISLSPAPRQSELGLIQTVLPETLEDLLHFPGHPADNHHSQALPLMEQIRAQGPADQGGDSLILEKGKALQRLQVGQVHLLAGPLKIRVFRKEMDPGAPVQHRGHPGAKYGYGQNG